MSKQLTALLLASLCGCQGSSTKDGEGEGDGTPDRTPPVIEITAPQRGTFAEDDTIVVSGKVTDADSGVGSVTLNGQPLTVDSGGMFTTMLTVPVGITILETVATDNNNNTSNDARAVLSGPLAPINTPVANGVAAHLSGQAMEGLTDMVANLANNTNFTTLATALNPIVDTGNGCNSAKIYVQTVTKTGVEVEAKPITGGIDTDISVRGLRVTGRLTFRALCFSGSAGWSFTASAYDVGGKIVPALNNNDITVGLSNVTSGFRAFDLNLGSLPGFIVDLFEGRVRDTVASILRGKITQMVPPMANAFLGEFLADSWAVPLLGQAVEISMWPTDMVWGPDGGLIVLDTNSTIEGLEDAMYLSTPRPRPTNEDIASTGIRIGIADDVVNQMLSAIWASGALEDAILPVQDDALSAAFGGDVASAELTIMLPPVANFDTTTGTGRLTLGDVMVKAVGQSGQTLAAFVVSAEVELAVETRSDGSVKIITRTPRIAAQILEQSTELLTPLDNLKVSAIAELAIKQISLKADELLDSLPVPGLADATIMSPTFQPVGGYLLMGGQLVFSETTSAFLANGLSL